MRKALVLHPERCTGCALCEVICGPAHFKENNPKKTEYETIGMLGSSCLADDIEDVQDLNYLCDDLGMDTIAAGGTIAFAMECFENGILNQDRLEGIDLQFGNLAAIKEILKKVAYQEGIGRPSFWGLGCIFRGFSEATAGRPINQKEVWR